MPTVNANKHTAHDLQLAGQMRREDYKTIKHMDKATLCLLYTSGPGNLLSLGHFYF